MSHRDKARQKNAFEKKRRELRSTSEKEGGVPIATDERSWPIKRAYVPIDDVFRATGFGTAAVVRQRPDGKIAYAFFMISLLDEGIQAMFGKGDSNEEDFEELLTDSAPAMPPFEEGAPDLAAKYIWGAHALGLRAGYDNGPGAKPLLHLVPTLSGTKDWWLQQLTGPNGLSSPGLVRFLREHPVPDDIPEDKEVMVWTTAAFLCEDPSEVRAELMRRGPEFIFNGADDDGVGVFSWTREYPKQHWSPFSKLGGRQVLGSVKIYADHITADAKVLSMAAILIGKLKKAFGEHIRLKETRWKSSEDMLREAGHGT
jgi:hypothetical protein